MKRGKYLITALATLFAFVNTIYAASGSLSVSKSNVYVGDSFTVSVNINSAAAWNVHVTATGPVSGCTINEADASGDAMDTNKKFNATCKATGEGTITLKLSGDVTSASDGNAVNLSGSKSVTVLKKTATQSSNNNLSGKSTNNKLKSLSVDGYELVKVDDNNYTLTVPNDVSTITIKATAADSKAKVTGSGEQKLNIGETNIKIIVTSEAGTTNKINIKVTRSDGYYLKDLDSLLGKEDLDEINIIIDSDTIITKEDFEKIKNSKKTVDFNYLDEDKDLLYSYIVDGTKIDNINDLLTTIVYDSDNKSDILRLSNYADSLFFNFKHEGNIPSGIKIKLYVGNKYNDGDLVNVYGYIDGVDNLDLIESQVKVDKGFVEITKVKASDYIVTMSNVNNSGINQSNNSSSLVKILLLIILILILIIIYIFVKINKKYKKY